MPSIFSLIDAIDSDRVRSWQFYEDRQCLMTIEGKKEGRKGRRLICASIGFFIYKIILIDFPLPVISLTKYGKNIYIDNRFEFNGFVYTQNNV